MAKAIMVDFFLLVFECTVKMGKHNYFFKKVVLIAQLLHDIHDKVMFFFTDLNILLHCSESVLCCTEIVSM